jgi:hypothetical protein
VYVLGALAGLVLFGPGTAGAQAASPATGPNGPTSGSGGPGTLGTEAPIDSAVAQGYYHSRSSVDGDGRQLAESIRQLITDNRRALQQAQASASSDDAAMADAAKQVADARSIAEFNLLKSAQESGFDLGDAVEGGFAAVGSMGVDSADLPSYGTNETATAAAEAAQSTGSSESSSSAESSDSSSLGSTAQSDAQSAASTIGDLVDQARDEHRYQLASSLEVAQRALDSAANASSALSSNTGTSK